MQTISLDRVIHVGTMDIMRKRKGSLEGTGLSISLCPSAWERISRQTEGGWNMLEKKNSKFLLATSLSQKDRLKVADWGIKHGYAEKTQAYAVVWFDMDRDEDVEMVFATREEAEREIDEDMEIEVRDETLVATSKMNEEVGYEISPLLTFDLLMTIYAEQNGYDGVYWDEELDVSRLSAPRGVIANSKLGEWRVTRDKKLINECFEELYCPEVMGW